MAEKIGILAGWEQSMPQAFIERCNKVPGIKAEFATIGGTPERFRCPYRVLVDRISQEVKHYRFYLKAAALSGSFVINDPLWWSADDKFFGYSLSSRLGVATPRTVMLPPFPPAKEVLLIWACPVSRSIPAWISMSPPRPGPEVGTPMLVISPSRDTKGAATNR